MKPIKSVIVALGLAAMAAQAVAAVELKSEAFREVEVTDKDGKKTRKLEPLTRATPGQEVIYVLTYRNTGKEAASNVVVNNPVPAELTYVAGSASGKNTRFDVSVDGGKQFAPLEKLIIKKADGTTRPASATDVTNLRWTVTAPLKAGADGSVTYRTILK